MNIAELKYYIKDLPDDMNIASYSEDNITDKKATEIAIIEWSWFGDFLDEWIKYLLIK